MGNPRAATLFALLRAGSGQCIPGLKDLPRQLHLFLSGLGILLNLPTRIMPLQYTSDLGYDSREFCRSDTQLIKRQLGNAAIESPSRRHLISDFRLG
jgi:hypothetical protein